MPASTHDSTLALAEVAKSRTRLAIALISVCIAVIFATLLINRSLTQQRELLDKKHATLWESNGALRRAILISGPIEPLLENTIQSCLTREAFPEAFPLLDRTPPKSFPASAARILASDLDVERKRELLRGALMLAASHQLPDQVAKKFAATLTGGLKKLNDLERLKVWLIYPDNSPLCPFSFGRTGGPPKVSWSDRSQVRWDSWDENGYQHSLLADAQTKEALLKLAQVRHLKAYEDLRSVPAEEPTLAGFGLPGSVAAKDLLVVAGLVLVLLQGAFLIFVEREKSLLRLPMPKLYHPPFNFPIFYSPRDPFASPPPVHAGEVLQRAAWATFLLAPALIILLGILTRFDLVTWTEWREEGLTILHKLAMVRAADRLSIGLDLANLTLLAASMVIAAWLSAPRDLTLADRSPRLTNPSQRWWPALIISIDMVLLIVWFTAATELPAHYGNFLVVYESAVRVFSMIAIVCGLAAFAAARLRSLLGAMVPTLALALLLLMSFVR